MPEFRHDPVSGRWVIIAGERAGRPEEYRRAAVTRLEIECPFCRGREHQTTPTVAWYGPPGASSEQWEVRVIPNKYPALAIEHRTREAGLSESSLDAALFGSRAGVGKHEVVIESPEHVESYTGLSDDQGFWTLAAYRDRLRVHRGEGRFAAASVFKNLGPDGGASLVHAHSQIMLLPETPETLARELDTSAAFRRRHGVCVFCAMLDRETQHGVRVVAESPGFFAVCPFASRFAYEMWIVPRRHASRFEETDDATLRDASLLLKRAIRAMEDVLDRPAYNYFLHTSPLDRNSYEHYHWHIELFPRTAKAAGLEWSAGWHLNTTPPEGAAAALRETFPPR
ncbi:MAG: HIT domain-containing protein [Planctomycetes bacterium]|nr:HIT domain-containing protein [Planctomycetota bacterium]